MEVILFSMLVVALILLSISNYKEKNMKYDLEIAQHENLLLKKQNKKLKYENELLKSYRSYYYQNHTCSKTNSDEFKDEIKEAVKYAMKKSHPDNNGNTKDFEKFRKLYEKIK